MVCRTVPTTEFIFSSVVGRDVRIGSLMYTGRDVELSTIITLEDVGILMFSCFIFASKTESAMKFAELEEMVSNQPDEDLRVLQDQIRIGVGDSPILKETQLNVKTGAVEGSRITNYYVLTKANSITDVEGNIVKKIRNLSVIPLSPEQVNLLTAQGFSIQRADGDLSLQEFIDLFDDPIKMNGEFVNQMPVTTLIGGGSSQENLGVFDPTVLEFKDETDSRFLNLDSDKQNRDTDFIPLDRLTAQGVNPDDTSFNKTSGIPEQPKINGIIVPLGIFLLLTGGL